MLVLHVPNALQNTASDCIAQIFRRRLRVDVTQVHSPVQPLGANASSHTSHTSHAPHRIGRIGREWREWNARSLHWRMLHRLRNERLRSGSLRRLRRRLLRLGDVRAAILAIIDALAGPCWLSREGCDNLPGKMYIRSNHLGEAVIVQAYFRRCRDAQEVHETDVLVPHNLHLVDQPKPAQIVSQLLLGHILIQTTDIHISARVALLNAQRHLTWHGAWLSPTNLKLLTMQGQFLDRRVGME
jgi:hypothetical protein